GAYRDAGYVQRREHDRRQQLLQHRATQAWLEPQHAIIRDEQRVPHDRRAMVEWQKPLRVVSRYRWQWHCRREYGLLELRLLPSAVITGAAATLPPGSAVAACRRCWPGGSRGIARILVQLASRSWARCRILA